MMSKMSMRPSLFRSVVRFEPVSPKSVPTAVASVMSIILSSLTSPLSNVIVFSMVSGAVIVGLVQVADR